MEITSDMNSLLTMIVKESVNLNKKLIKVDAEMAVQHQKNAVVFEALEQQGVSVDFYA